MASFFGTCKKKNVAMKRIGLWVIGTLCALGAAAQEEKDDFTRFLENQEAEFNKFVDDANKEFISFMRNPWKEFKAEKPVAKRVKPEPVKPVVYDGKAMPEDLKPVCLDIEEILDLTTSEGKQRPVVKAKDVEDITFDKPTVIVKKKQPTVVVVERKPVDEPKKEPAEEPVAEPVVKPGKKPVVTVESVEKPAVTPEVKPVTVPAVKPEPVSRPEAPALLGTPLFAGGTNRVKIFYAGRNYYPDGTLKGKCRLPSLTEDAIADAYEALCGSDYKPLLADLGVIRKEVAHNDWALFVLVKQVAEACCGTYNEAIVMRQFLLNEMGYKARMARKADGNRLVLYVPTDCMIYGCTYVMVDGRKYYDLDNKKPYSFYMCAKDSPKAKNLVSMFWKQTPYVEGKAKTGTFQAKGDAAGVTVNVPEALIDFYKSYPQCDYSVYFNAQVNPGVIDALRSFFAPRLAGKSRKEAAGILLNFVQTAFRYATDDEQFGYEKPFFAEELFYYPYCDCEDRSILYSCLVRKLIGLDVVLLDYPDHIATAVRFDEDVSGDYLMVDGNKYTVCDPTYIGASIGMAMPQYKNVAAKVLKY